MVLMPPTVFLFTGHRLFGLALVGHDRIGALRVRRSAEPSEDAQQSGFRNDARKMALAAITGGAVAQSLLLPTDM